MRGTGLSLDQSGSRIATREQAEGGRGLELKRAGENGAHPSTNTSSTYSDGLPTLSTSTTTQLVLPRSLQRFARAPLRRVLRVEPLPRHRGAFITSRLATGSNSIQETCYCYHRILGSQGCSGPTQEVEGSDLCVSRSRLLPVVSNAPSCASEESLSLESSGVVC